VDSVRAFLPPGFHQFTSIADYQEGLIDRLFPEGNSVRMTPEAARKLTEDAISYARGLGFSPGADYKEAGAALPRRGTRYLQDRNGARFIQRHRIASCVCDALCSLNPSTCNLPFLLEYIAGFYKSFRE
jgi:hypothetical protein